MPTAGLSTPVRPALPAVPFAAAVLTGDLVASTRAGAGAIEATMAVLSATCAAGWLSLPARFTRFRGDGWQMLAAPGQAMRLALLLQARLAAEDALLPSRIAIGFGEVTRTGSADLADADGSAFHRSGRLLAGMPRRLRLGVAAAGAPPALPVIAGLCDALAARWSTAQAEALVPALHPETPTQAAIAAQLGLSQQAVQERLSLAGFAALRNMLDWTGGEGLASGAEHAAQKV